MLFSILLYSNYFCFLVIASLASSKDDRAEAAKRAEQYLEEMKRRYANGDLNVKPNTLTYNAVMNAWARAGLPEKAESLLNEMYEEYMNNGNDDIKPRTDSFNSKSDSLVFLLIVLASYS